VNLKTQTVDSLKVREFSVLPEKMAQKSPLKDFMGILISISEFLVFFGLRYANKKIIHKIGPQSPSHSLTP